MRAALRPSVDCRLYAAEPQALKMYHEAVYHADHHTRVVLHELSLKLACRVRAVQRLRGDVWGASAEQMQRRISGMATTFGPSALTEDKGNTNHAAVSAALRFSSKGLQPAAGEGHQPPPPPDLMEEYFASFSNNTTALMEMEERKRCAWDVSKPEVHCGCVRGQAKAAKHQRCYNWHAIADGGGPNELCCRADLTRRSSGEAASVPG